LAYYVTKAAGCTDKLTRVFQNVLPVKVRSQWNIPVCMPRWGWSGNPAGWLSLNSSSIRNGSTLTPFPIERRTLAPWPSLCSRAMTIFWTDRGDMAIETVLVATEANGVERRDWCAAEIGLWRRRESGRRKANRADGIGDCELARHVSDRLLDARTR
jgi:hypothetical protein